MPELRPMGLVGIDQDKGCCGGDARTGWSREREQMARKGMVLSPGTPLHHQASILHQAASQWGDLFPYRLICMASQVVLVVKNLPANADVRDTGSIRGLGRSPGEGNGNTLQYSCLENPMDRGAW